MSATRRKVKGCRRDCESACRRMYMDHLRRRGYSSRTLTTYACLLAIFSRWLYQQGIESETGVGLADLERFLGWLNTDHELTNAGSRANFVKALRGFYRFLVKERQILTDPTQGLRYPKVPKRVHRVVLSKQELARLLSVPNQKTALGVRDAVVLRLMAMAGLRISELEVLETSRVDLGNREVLVRKGKGGKDRVVFFDGATREVLERYLSWARPRLLKQPALRLVIGPKGRPVGEIVLRKIVRENVAKAGIRRRVTPHSLRRTFAVLLLQGGCNLKAIAEIMGHDELTTTAGYTQLDTANLSKVYDRTHPLGGRSA